MHSILNYRIEIYGRVSGWTTYFPAEHLQALRILLRDFLKDLFPELKHLVTQQFGVRNLYPIVNCCIKCGLFERVTVIHSYRQAPMAGLDAYLAVIFIS